MYAVRWNHRPRLRFIDPPTPPEGTPGVGNTATGPDGLPVKTVELGKEPKDGDGGDGDLEDPKDLGFPLNTPRDQMTPDQREAFWKHQARKHERTADKAQRALDDAQAAARDAAKTDEQRREDELRREGQAIGAEPFIKIAVRGELRAATGLDAAAIDKLLEFSDPNAFLTNGLVDDTKIADYAAHIKPASSGEVPGRPPASVLAGLGGAGSPRGGASKPEGGSLRDKKKAARERLDKRSGRSRG